VLDALSRLVSTKAQFIVSLNENVLEDVQKCFYFFDEIGVYNVIMIEMDPDFAARIKLGYVKNTVWQEDIYKRLRRGG
jgi:hypothetical protein